MTSPIFKLRPFLLPYRIQIAGSIASSIANKIFDLMPPLLVGWTIDSLRGSPPHWISYFIHSQAPLKMAIFLSGLAVVIFAFESLFQWAYQYGFLNIAQGLQHDVRLAVYAHLQYRELAFFESHRLGETLSVVNDDVNQLERFLNNGVNEFLQLAVLIFVSGAILLSLSWRLAIIGFLPVPAIIWGSWYYHKLISPRYSRVREKVGQIVSRLENNIGGIQVVKSFTAEDFEVERVRESSAAYLLANGAAIRLSAAYTPLIRMLIVVGFAGVLLVGSYWVLQNNGTLTVGELVLFAMMTERLLWPLTRVGPTVDDFERANASARRIFQVLETPSKIVAPLHPTPITRAKGDLVFQAVTFRYPDIPEPVIQDFSTVIHHGEFIGIAGATGSGKSTLLKLLLRFYDTQTGDILLDGIPLKSLDPADLRRQIALVSQDVYLFHGSIFDNIAYGLPGASLSEVQEVARLAELDQFIANLPQGYSTIVGERGIKLSGGQRQRLSIARALLKNAPILVFDEATSAVDTETEKAIQGHIGQFIAGKTAIVVAHRLSTIRHAHRILVLDKGRLVDEGSHEELIRKNGIYAELWDIQIGG